MQTILGGGGAIETEVAKALTEYTKDINIVSRNPQKVNGEDHFFRGDLRDANSTMEALKGSEVAYLTVGLPYNTKIWHRDWPVIMENTINACLQNDCRLVFFDNIYMYRGII